MGSIDTKPICPEALFIAVAAARSPPRSCSTRRLRYAKIWAIRKTRENMTAWLTSLKVKWWFSLSARKYQREQYAEALEIVQKVILVCPNSASALVRAGSCLRNLKRYDEAIGYLGRALQTSRNCGEPHAYLSLVLCDLEHYQEAVESLDRAFRIDPKLATAQFWLHQLGFMQGKVGQYEQALATYARLSELNPKYEAGWRGIGWANAQLKRYSEAATAYKCAAALKPEDAELQRSLGSLYLELKRPKEAVDHLERSIRLAATAETYCDLGRGFFDMGAFDDEKRPPCKL
jgi:tetratricopeptide (TPR) repeat protein